jgi:hypothetical protein
MFASRGFKCKISLVNTKQEHTLKGGYEQKETVSIPYRYFKEKAMYIQDKLEIPSVSSVNFVDFFKGIPIYMKKKYDEYNKTKSSPIVNDNKTNKSTLSNNETPTIVNETPLKEPISEPIEKLKESEIVNIDKITENHPVELVNEKEEERLDASEKEKILKKMEGLDFLKIEFEDGYEEITEKKKGYKELEMIKDFIFYLIDKKKEIEIEKGKILKSEKGIVVIEEVLELKDVEKMKEYIEKEKIKGSALYKELELM